MRAFVSGGSGFVGGWLIAHLREAGDDVHAPPADVTDAEAVRAAIDAVRPEVVYHLAGQADVGESWRDPATTFTVNATGTLHVLDAARRLAEVPRVLIVSSAEVYGIVSPEALPLDEDDPARPVSPYGVSKVAAEQLGLQAWRGSGLPVIITRAFNHIGPRQSDRFVVSAIARQIAEAERVGSDTIGVGNTMPRRDVTDVRDVVRAYRLAATAGEPGEIYNVCSGSDVSIGELVDRLCALAARPIRPVPDPERVRAVDVPVLRGDPSKLEARTAWRRQHALDDSLRDVLAFWRNPTPASG